MADRKDREISPAVALLASFLQQNDITQTAAGDALGVTGVSVNSWLGATKRPKAHHRELIARWTGGAVPVESWLFVDERSSFADVKPFEPASSTDVTASAESGTVASDRGPSIASADSDEHATVPTKTGS